MFFGVKEILSSIERMTGLESESVCPRGTDCTGDRDSRYVVQRVLDESYYSIDSTDGESQPKRYCLLQWEPTYERDVGGDASRYGDTEYAAVRVSDEICWSVELQSALRKVWWYPTWEPVGALDGYSGESRSRSESGHRQKRRRRSRKKTPQTERTDAWSVRRSKRSGVLYYLDPSTGKKSWKPPVCVAHGVARYVLREQRRAVKRLLSEGSLLKEC